MSNAGGSQPYAGGLFEHALDKSAQAKERREFGRLADMAIGPGFVALQLIAGGVGRSPNDHGSMVENIAAAKPLQKCDSIHFGKIQVQNKELGLTFHCGFSPYDFSQGIGPIAEDGQVTIDSVVAQRDAKKGDVAGVVVGKKDESFPRHVAQLVHICCHSPLLCYCKEKV